MHEMALCRNVVDIVLEEAEKARASKVVGVYLTVGYSRDIVEDLFEKMFTWMCRDAVAADAQLCLTRVPVTVQCKDCDLVYHIDVHDSDTWLCPRCGVKHYRLNSGMEFFINDIEVVQSVSEEGSAEEAA